ncbi:MAG: hypothetical protein JSS87_13720 [Acidobacteria bacterium]|nr:hypothetical protein [Acidobacteriota bacterium]
MPNPTQLFPSTEDEGLNFRLWVGILLPPIAGGINTMVGYAVSNYDCNVHNRHFATLVNFVCFVLCGIAAFTAFSTRQKIDQRKDDNSLSLFHTRRFMFRLGLAISAGFAVMIIAGFVSVLILHPCDL